MRSGSGGWGDRRFPVRVRAQHDEFQFALAAGSVTSPRGIAYALDASTDSSCPALCRASTALFPRKKDVDGRDKPGHDGAERPVDAKSDCPPPQAGEGTLFHSGYYRPQVSSCLPIGSARMRLPVAAKIALISAGANGGTPGSPTPLGGTSGPGGTI
ncbi:hypothetical protein ABIB82_005719 [Bradyrhizobium sp. i1.8.4]